MRVAFLAAIVLAAIPSVARSDQFVYVHDRSSPGQVYGFRLGGNGSLTSVSGSPIATGLLGGDSAGTCQTASYSKKRKLLVASGTEGIAIFAVANDGSLAPLEGSPFLLGFGAFVGVAVADRDDRTFVYVTHSDANTVEAREILENGTLATVVNSPYSVDQSPVGCATSKDHLLVCSQDDQTLRSFLIAANGSLTEKSSVTVAGAVQLYNAQLSRDARFAYHSTGTSEVYAYEVGVESGSLSTLDGAPFPLATADSPFAAVVGKKVLVVLGGNAGDDLEVFRRVKKSGKLKASAGSPSGLGTALSGAIDRKDKFVVVASGAELRSLAIDEEDLTLTTADIEPCVGEPTAVLVIER